MGTITDDLKDLQEAQAADHDGRIKAREADHFVNKKDGQWEPEIYNLFGGQPRYTLDLTSGIVADICGEMNSMDFDIKVSPAGGPATTEIANHYDGLIRNIENNSGPGAKYIYRAAGKQMVTTVLGGWGVKQGYRDSQSFDQDLIIYPISNFMDRVWFDSGAELQDMSDANKGWKLTTMSAANYDRDFPDGSKISIGHDREHTVYDYKSNDAITVCQMFWKKPKQIELVRMTNGQVFVVDEKFNMVKDELAMQGITVERSRKDTAYTVYQRMMDGGDYLTDEQETVFTYIPLIPVFGNFEISEDKVIYWGVVEKHMDPQRILNYVESRKVAEGALAPRSKKWMTPEQAAGHEKQIRTLNTNNDPVQFYNHVPDQPPPFETGGAQINPGLTETSESMKGYMQSISGRMDPSRQTMGLQSGVALEALQNKGDTANYGYFTSMEIAISHTYRLCGTAIPKVYDAKREVQLDFQDGNSKTITINQRVFDQQSGQIVDLNDLSKGVYSFTCSAGPAFSNRQQETRAAITEIAAIDPSIMQVGSDILLANTPAPGMDKIAKRKRTQMIQQGLIPIEEMTDEERQQVQQQQSQQQQPGPAEQAMIAAAQAEQQKAQAQTADTISKTREREQKIQLQANKMMLDEQNKEKDRMMEMMKEQNSQIKLLADTLKSIKEAMGVETIIGPSNTSAYEEQSNRLLDTIRGSGRL